MIYYVNDKIVSYKIFEHYLIKSIEYQVNFTLTKKELSYLYASYCNDIKYYNSKITFKDNMSYKIKKSK